jgi:hypothetical protein
VKYKTLTNFIKNPVIAAFLLIIANMISFIPALQDPYFYMFGVLGNFFLTFLFSFLILTIALNLDQMFNVGFFKYLGYTGVLAYFYLYFTWIFSIHFTYVLGYFIMSYGVYVAFRFHTGKKRLTTKDLVNL